MITRILGSFAVLLALLVGAVPALAHPHIWIDARLALTQEVLRTDTSENWLARLESDIQSRHEGVPVRPLVQRAAAGDPDAVAELTRFVTTQSLNAPFDPEGHNTTIEWTAATDIPEPTSLALFGAGLAGLAFLRRQLR